jgi:site-specific DNA-methyltransferase (adenine-specific)
LSRPFHVAQKDAVEWLRTLGDGSVDLIVTDPPYESLEKHRSVGTTTRLKHSKASSNDWFQIFPNHRMKELFVEAHRVLAKDAHLYLFCDQETMFFVKPIAEASGFEFWKPIIWRKDTIGMGYHYRSLYEVILFFEKGKRKLNDLGIADVLDAPRVRNGYPAEKPPSLVRVLVSQSSSAGQVVVDPFMGSGTTGVAALEQDRIFWGTDICGEAVEITTGRLIQIGGVADELAGGKTGPSAVGGQLSMGLY